MNIRPVEYDKLTNRLPNIDNHMTYRKLDCGRSVDVDNVQMLQFELT